MVPEPVRIAFDATIMLIEITTVPDVYRMTEAMQFEKLRSKINNKFFVTS